MARPFLGGGFSQSRRAAQGCARQARGVRILTHPGLPRLPAWQDSSPRGFSRRPAGSACAASADTPFLRPRSESPCRELPAGCASLHQAAPRCTKAPRAASGALTVPARCRRGARHRLFVMAALEAGRGMSPAALPRPTGRWLQRRRRKCARLLPSFRPCRAACSSGSWPGMSARWAGWRLAWRSTWTARGTVWRSAGPFAGARTQPGQCRQPAKPMPCAAGETPALGLRARRD